MPPPAIQIGEAAADDGRGRNWSAVELALAVDRAAELAAPDDQRVIEQAALLQVLDQRGARLVAVRSGRRSAWGRSPCWSQPR